jgi:hypothetical protein
MPFEDCSIAGWQEQCVLWPFVIRVSPKSLLCRRRVAELPIDLGRFETFKHQVIQVLQI